MGPAERRRVFSTLGAKAADEAGQALPSNDAIAPVTLEEAPALPEARLPVINLTAPLPKAADVAKPEPAPTTQVQVAATALQTTSRRPSIIRAVASVAKWAALAAFLLIGGYYLTQRVLLPLYQELKHPTKGGVVDRQAPTAVQVIQQTRKVVAENNEKVEAVNAITREAETPAVAPPSSAAVSRPSTAAAPGATTAESGDERLLQIQRALDELKINGVTGGYEPRMVLDGRLIKFGDIVHHGLGLRFVRVDEQARELHFIDVHGTVYRRNY